MYYLTKPMMSGTKVQEIQQALMRLGFDPHGADGKFGPNRKPR
jgi:peptidoglycan hydrolase-like protein with peptidoglycan-binding domain